MCAFSSIVPEYWRQLWLERPVEKFGKFPKMCPSLGYCRLGAAPSDFARLSSAFLYFANFEELLLNV